MLQILFYTHCFLTILTLIMFLIDEIFIIPKDIRFIGFFQNIISCFIPILNIFILVVMFESILCEIFDLSSLEKDNEE